MLTSYFGRLRHLTEYPELTPISIATRPPQGVQIAEFRKLAPNPAMLRWPRSRYEPQYLVMLEGLDAQEVWDHLHRMAGGGEPVLICYEKPPYHEHYFCHRLFVAQWFKRELGHIVEEWQLNQPAQAAVEQAALF